MNPITGEPFRPKAAARHPGTETDAEVRSDQATIKLIKGRGFVLTFSSHFAVAVVVGVLGYVYEAQKHPDGPLTEQMGKDLRTANESIAALREDLSLFKAEYKQDYKSNEQRINELFAKTAGK